MSDESGEKLTDVGDLTFEDTPLDTSLQTLSKAIDHLAEILGGVPKQLTDVANAASQIPDNPFANWQPPRFDEANYMAQGGRVTANGVHYLAEGNIFTPRGSDVVPAMLTPGEEVSSASDVQSRNASMTALARQQAMTNEKLGNIEQLLRDNSSDLPRQLRDALLLAS